MAITNSQIRAARGILNWPQSELSERTGISVTSIGGIENGQTSPRESTMNLIQTTFEAHGIEFLPDEGVRTRQNDVRVFEGCEGLSHFLDHVRECIQATGGEICACNVDERLFMKWLGQRASDFIVQLNAIEGVSFKVLLREGDYNFMTYNYADYRILPQGYGAAAPFFIFSDKTGIVQLDSVPRILVLDYPAITQSFRTQFYAMWNLSFSSGEHEGKADDDAQNTERKSV
jgi:transcriptional regulator with XRE-family HTH domain